MTAEVGASGAIFGIAGAILAGIEVWRRGHVGSRKTGHPSSSVGHLVIILNFGMGMEGNIDNMCHLGGFVSGLMLGLPLGAFARKNLILQTAILAITAGVMAAGYRELVQTNMARTPRK